MTLRKRLTGTYIFVALVSLLLASIAGAILVRNAQVRAAESTMRLVTRVVASRAQGSGPNGIRPNDRAVRELVESVEGRLLLVDGDGIIIEDSEGTLVGEPLRDLARLAPSAAGDPPGVRRARVDGQPYFISNFPARQQPTGGRLIFAIPTGTLLGSWLVLLPGILLLSAFGVVIAAVVGGRISHTLAEPVVALTAAADKMAEGDFDTKVETPSDVVELQRLARSFNTMAHEVKEARQTQRDFLANVSHDLRTPLTSIQGFSQALMDGAVPGDQTPRVAGIINTEADRLSRLVQDLLDLARIEAGRFSMVQRDINLQQVLERCEEKFTLQAEAVGVAFEAKLSRRALPVHGDADRLEQVFTNLIDNAFTYAQEGGGHVRLKGMLGGIRGRPSSKEESNGHEEGEELTKKLGRWWVEITVEDDGPGISDEQKPLVFERFHRADRARGGSGLGLGLAIAREIVQAHGGDISIEDAKVRGTCFIVRLPMKMK